MTCSQIVRKVRSDAQKEGIKPWVYNTIRSHLRDMAKSGEIEHQEEAFFLGSNSKKRNVKAFILVYIKKGENYIEEFIKFMIEISRIQEHEDIIIMADVVLGASFSVIVQLTSTNTRSVGLFVENHIRTHRRVADTKTHMVRPTDSESAG